MKLRMRAVACALLLLCGASTAHAQKTLKWEAITVAARLEHDGALLVEEEQAMVFTGDWNGGERRFNIRPRQGFEFIDIARLTDDGWQVLAEDSDVDSIDDFAFTERYTLRWRSRMPSDLPFSGQVIRYRLRYRLSNILVTDGNDFTLDHDFLFPDRDGAIDRFSLKLELNPVWLPKAEAHETYSAENIPPGRGFVVTIPLRYTGDLAPGIRDTSRPPEIVQATLLLLGFSGLALAWFFLRERSLGRFEPMPAGVDEAWLMEHILSQPAEVVGATWDDGIGSPEVVSLIARLESEEKLKSDLKGGEIKLHLLVDRDTLEGYERTLIDKLFFGNRTTTSPTVIKSHYKKQGLQPAEEISKGLGERVDALLGPHGKSKVVGLMVLVLTIAGLVMGFLDWREGRGRTWGTPGTRRRRTHFHRRRVVPGRAVQDEHSLGREALRVDADAGAHRAHSNDRVPLVLGGPRRGRDVDHALARAGGACGGDRARDRRGRAHPTFARGAALPEEARGRARVPDRRTRETGAVAARPVDALAARV